jgi:hypothetical protein
MVLDFVESRVANPVKLADWGEIEEAQSVVCGCCGWAGPLGECDNASVGDARAYTCRQCSMALVVRAYPNVIALRPGMWVNFDWTEERPASNM